MGGGTDGEGLLGLSGGVGFKGSADGELIGLSGGLSLGVKRVGAAVRWGNGVGLVGCAIGGPEVEGEKKLGGAGPRRDWAAVIGWAAQEEVSAGRGGCL